MQIHAPTVVQGGEIDDPPPPFPSRFIIIIFLDMLQYFKTILPLVESLWSF